MLAIQCVRLARWVTRFTLERQRQKTEFSWMWDSTVAESFDGYSLTCRSTEAQFEQKKKIKINLFFREIIS